MQEIVELLQEANRLNDEWERIEAIPFPAVRRVSRRHFRHKLRRFLVSVEKVSDGFGATNQEFS